MWDYQVAVLGGGPGGYVAAIRCAQLGLKTALIEARELGGTCLNRGCIPTKALLQGAEAWQTVQNAGRYGIETERATLDYGRLAAFKDETVRKLRRGVEFLEKAHGVQMIRGFGVLQDSHTIRVDNVSLTAEQIILAMGSAPFKPNLPGMESDFVLTSDEALAWDTLPDSVVLIGGGVIGIEFATLLSSLGVRVSVLEMLPDILPGMDAEITAPLKRLLRGMGTEISTEACVTAVKAEEQNTSVYYTQGEQEKIIQAERCIVCVGRKPMTSRLGLETTGVILEKGYVKADALMRTSVPHLYAVGDITGQAQLAHLASAQGLVAAANCAGQALRMRYDIVPACVYTHPEIAAIGKTEELLRQEGRDIKVGRYQVAGNGRAMTLGEAAGLAKIVTDARTGEILGAQLMAPHATEMISEIAVAMRAEGTVEELSDTVHPHPTISEVWMEAAHDIEGFSVHMPPKDSY